MEGQPCPSGSRSGIHVARNKPRTYFGKIAEAREDIAHLDLRRLPTLSARPYLRYLRPSPPFRLTFGHSGGVGPPHRAEQDLGPSGSGGHPTPGIASAAEHAEQTDAEKHQARRLRDEGDVDEAGTPGGAVGAETTTEAAGAAGHVDGGPARGVVTARSKQDRHPAAAAPAPGGGVETAGTGEVGAATSIAPGCGQAARKQHSAAKPQPKEWLGIASQNRLGLEIPHRFQRSSHEILFATFWLTRLWRVARL